MKTIKPDISSQGYHKINLNSMHREFLKIKHHKNHPERLKRIRKWTIEMENFVDRIERHYEQQNKDKRTHN
ncbi:hypothetical protein JT359_17055 [Candidatus Poribacteria bacterium]|nr:hypothetical protein [Candidatus Poribacteria bacterium]